MPIEGDYKQWTKDDMDPTVFHAHTPHTHT